MSSLLEGEGEIRDGRRRCLCWVRGSEDMNTAVEGGALQFVQANRYRPQVK